MKIYLSLVVLSVISVSCGTHRRNPPKPVEVPETIAETNQDPVNDAAADAKKTTANNKAEILGQTVATCKNPRGPFVLCESGKPLDLGKILMQTDYADLVGRQIEVHVSFQGSIKALEAFSVNADSLASAALLDGSNPVVSLTFKAPAEFNLSVKSLLENNPQLMDADFLVDLKDVKFVVLPGPVTQAEWAEDMKSQLDLLNGPDAGGRSAAVQKSQNWIQTIDRYKVQDSAALKDLYQQLKAALAASN